MSALSEHETANATAQHISGFHGVRYLVTDVKRALDFYVTNFGFVLEHQQLPAFASVELGPLKILLSGPSASGSRPLPSGERQYPGGSNRVVLRVSELPAVIEALRGSGVEFRNAMETGPGGRQIQVEDPDGNSLELFEPARQDKAL
jgi:glyoxylase I family protein